MKMDPAGRKRGAWRIRRWLLAAGAIILIPTYCVPSLRSKTGVNVSREDCPFDVPVEASEICYYRREAFGPASYCEFKVPEAAFLEWAKQKWGAVKPIGEQPFTIRRYPNCTSIGDGSRPQAARVDIRRGWYFEQMTDPDTGTQLAYDAEAGRAYVYYQMR